MLIINNLLTVKHQISLCYDTEEMEASSTGLLLLLLYSGDKNMICSHVAELMVVDYHFSLDLFRVLL